MQLIELKLEFKVFKFSKEKEIINLSKYLYKILINI